MIDSILPRPAQNDNSLLGDSSDAMRDILENTLRQAMQREFAQKRSAPAATHAAMGGWTNATEHATGSSIPVWAATTWRSRGYAKATTFPSLLEHRTRSAEVLVALVQEAFVGGVSRRKMGKLVDALGVKSVSKSQVKSAHRLRHHCVGDDGESLALRTAIGNSGQAACGP